VNPPYLREGNAGVYLSLKVQPRASRNKIAEVQGSELKVCVTAPPVDSAANEALVEYLREMLQCARKDIELCRGQTSRHKTVFVRGLAVSEILRRLGKE
jgi:uncharacterized protein (TIGR00251 family)